LATAATLIARAHRLLGLVGSGESPTADEYADGLIALNAMLDSWNNERLMCYAMRDESLTLAVSTTSYSIGPAGALITTRPVQIEAAYVVYGSTSYSDVRIINEEEYAAIPDKTSAATWPDRIYYQPTMPNGTLYVYPVPNAASALHLITRTPLTAFSATTDTVSLPPGWEEALATNLAIEIAPEYQTEPKQAVYKMATESKANIKRQNFRPIKAGSELAMLVGVHRTNIITDT
jgi:hypothetical protein